jgi:hypothetical protein
MILSSRQERPLATLDYQNRDDARREQSVLRHIFGPSKEEVWQRLAGQIGGKIIDRGFFKGKRFEANVDEWTVTLDVYTESHGETSSTYTRIRAPYINRDGFRFRVYRTNVWANLAKKLGMQDIEIGDPFFDHNFIIQANDQAKVKRLLSSLRIRQLIDAQPKINFTVKDDDGWFRQRFPDGVDELYFRATGVIKDVAQLRLLYELFSETLNELCLMGSAYQRNPQIDLP